MKKFFIRFFACFIINSKKRRIFREKYLHKDNEPFDISINDFILSDTIKAKCIYEDIKTKKKSVKTMVTGSSHAQMSFIDTKDTINFGNGSQDLYYQWKIYEKFCSFFPNLKNIVLFYDVFSNGNDMQKGPCHTRTAVYHYLFKIPYKDENLAFEQGTYDFEKELVLKYLPVASNLTDVIDHSYPVVCGPSPEFIEKQLKEFAYGQIKLNKKDNGMHQYLEKILKLSKKHGHNVLIVVSPYEKEFRQLFPSKNDMFSTLNKMAQKYNVPVLNCYDDDDFIHKDFRNIDHLNKAGAIKMTKKIQKALK